MFKKFIRDHKIHKDIVLSSSFDYVFLCNPSYLFGPIAMLLVGMYLGSFANAQLQLGITSVNIKTSFFVFGISLVICCIFIKDKILSIQEGSASRFSFVEKSLVGDRIEVKTANLIHNVLLGIGFLLVLGTSWINSFIIAAVYFSWLHSINFSGNLLKSLGLFTLISFFLILSGWLYIDSLFNSYLTFMLFFLLAIPYVCLFLATIILISFDFNKSNSFIGMFLVTIGFLIAYYNNDPVGATVLSVSFPFYLFLFLRGAERDLIRAIRYPIFLLNFFLFTIYPLLMIPMTIIYYISKYYYWHRFDIHFPALAINNDYD